MKNLCQAVNKASYAALLLLALGASQQALAGEYSPEKMSCQEFINLNPQAMQPVALWMMNQDTIYKGGDSVDLKMTDVTAIPQIVEFCKKNPQKDLYAFKSKLANVLPN